MTRTPRILITPGEPAGIGPDITIRIAQQNWDAELICVADPKLMQSRAKQIGLPLTLIPFDSTQPATPHQIGTLKIISASLAVDCETGKLNRDNANYILECLRLATNLCLHSPKEFALVTGPVQKSIINEAGIVFSGHTEFLAQQCGVTHPLMLFVTDQCRVALATTHLPLSQIPKAITSTLLIDTIEILHSELQTKFGIPQPSILVCGLNPHAGENGHLGREEIEVISPALEVLRKKNLNIRGPLPADTVFTEKYLATTDCVLAMYHDQALPTVKYMSFGHAVNVTLGLPIVRTSVDHGTALDIAGTLQADAGSMVAAIQLAIQLLSPSNTLPWI